MKQIVVVGSINMDLVARVQHQPTPGQTVTATGFAAIPGGKGANQAVAAARLGTPVAMIGRLGDDAHAKALRAGLQAEGMDDTAILNVPGPSGTAMITVSDDGANAIVVVPGANDALQPDDLHASGGLLRSAAMVLAQLETPLATVERLAALCAAAGVPLMLDPAPAQPLPSTLLRHVTWLTPNESEAAALLRNAGVSIESPPEPAHTAAALLALGARNVALKLGSRGVFLQGLDADPIHVAAFPVTPVDTTAAGDCWNGAFAVALAQGNPAAAAARFACAAAALSTMAHGAQPSLPARKQVENLLLRSR